MTETTTPASTDKSYLSLKLGRAAKTGSRSQGYIHYRILKEPDQELLHIAIIGNDGGGCYSKEIVPFDKVELCLKKVDINKPIASKLFEQAFVGRSANNAGFMAAILRAEHLLVPAPNTAHQHTVQPDWATWKTAMLALSGTAEHYQPEPPKPRIKPKITTEPIHENNQAHSGVSQDLSAGTETVSDTDEVITASGARDDADLDELEMELLQRSALSTDITNQDEHEIDPAETVTTVLDKQQSKKLRTIRRPHPTGQENRHDRAS